MRNGRLSWAKEEVWTDDQAGKWLRHLPILRREVARFVVAKIWWYQPSSRGPFSSLGRVGLVAREIFPILPLLGGRPGTSQAVYIEEGGGTLPDFQGLCEEGCWYVFHFMGYVVRVAQEDIAASGSTRKLDEAPVILGIPQTIPYWKGYHEQGFRTRVVDQHRHLGESCMRWCRRGSHPSLALFQNV